MCSDSEILSYGVKTCKANRVLSNHRKKISGFFARCFRARVMFERDYHTLKRIVQSEVKVIIAGCMKFCVVNMKGHCYDLKM